MHRLYETEDIVVFWNSDKCRHEKKCVTGSPVTFDFQRRPWIDLTQAPTMKIWQTVKSCPSGALGCVYTHDVVIVLEAESFKSAAYKDGRLIGECVYEDGTEGRVIYHTGVDEAFTGRGIAKRLVYKVLEDAERKGLKVIPTCPYARKVLEE